MPNYVYNALLKLRRLVAEHCAQYMLIHGVAEVPTAFLLFIVRASSDLGLRHLVFIFLFKYSSFVCFVDKPHKPRNEKFTVNLHYVCLKDAPCHVICITRIR